ncbi:MAG: hypothetical protein HOF87_15985, partial [Gemmatimonadales bacterium]|nr:hypothetical protein [Gemmatimonadales bacterium]
MVPDAIRLPMGKRTVCQWSPGDGPRDGLAMGLAQKVKRSLRVTRNSIEATVLVIAFFLGGSIGLGTVIFAVLMGPTMQASL